MTMTDGASRSSRSRWAVGLAILSSAVLPACGASSTTASPPSFPKLTITAGANGYTTQPTTPLPAGTIELDLRNDSRLPTQFMFGTPFGTTTLAQVKATVTSHQLDQVQHEVEFGFGWALPPTQSQTIYLTYRASTNFVLSLISRGPNTPVQAAQGFLTQFTVTGTAPKAQPQPAVAGTLTVTAHSVSVPHGFGKGIFAMLNTDTTAGHELSFFRFTGAVKPLSDVVATFAAVGQAAGPGPPTGTPPEVALGLRELGGAQPLPAFGCSCIMGSRVEGRFNFSPGTYVVLGSGVDPTTNVLEATQGIAAEFTVT